MVLKENEIIMDCNSFLDNAMEEERKDYGKNSVVKNYFTTAADGSNVYSTSSGTGSTSVFETDAVVELVETTINTHNA